MSDTSCIELVESYVRWLREGLLTRMHGDVCEITTPFLNRHNDCMQIYIKRSGQGFVLTDDSVTLRDLEMGGVDLNTERRKKELENILNGFGVKVIGDELQVDARADNFAQRKHCLLQAMLAIDDLHVLAQPKVESFFREDVERFLALHDVRFTANVTFIGKSGFTQHFDFVIPQSREKPERILKAVPNPRRDSVSALIFSWDDIRQQRAENAVAIAVLNDTDRPVSSEAVSALRSYDIRAMNWSERDTFSRDLAA